MAFTLSGSVITQSGTDTSLAGLSGIEGVTVQTITGIYPLTIYTLSARQLQVTGTLNMGSREKLIFTGQPAQDNILNINNGTFNVFEDYVRNSFTAQLPIEAIVFSLSSSGGWKTTVINVQGSGKLIAKNAIFRIPHSIWFNQNRSGQVLLEDCIIDKRGSVGDIQTNLAGSVANNTVLRRTKIYADGQSGLTFRNQNAPTIDSVEVYQSRDAWSNETGTLKIVRGLVPELGNLVDVSQAGASNHTAVVNARNGVQFLWGGHLADAGANTGQVGVWQELTANVKTLSGTAIQDAVFYIAENPIASDPAQTALQSPLGGTVNTTQRRVFIDTTDESGNIPTKTLLIGSGLRTVGGLQIVGGDSNRIRPRGKNTTALVDASDDIYDYSIWSYNHLGQTNPIVLKGGTAGLISASATGIQDTNVTLSRLDALTKLASSFTVNTTTNTITVTANSTLDDLYDAMKAWKCTATQTNLEYPTINTQPVNASGTNLVTAMNIVGLEFLTAGTKFKSISANGTANGAISNLSIAGNVSQATPTNLTNVTIDGTLTYNTNTDVGIQLTTTTIETIINNGTGIVTIEGGTISNYTDSEINYLNSTATVILTNGYDTFTIHTSQEDADNGTNPIFSGTDTDNIIKYKAESLGSVPIWIRATISNNATTEIYRQQNVPNGVGNYTFSSVAFSESRQLANIQASIENLQSQMANKPTLNEIESSTVLAKQTTLDKVKSNTDLIPAIL